MAGQCCPWQSDSQAQLVALCRGRTLTCCRLGRLVLAKVHIRRMTHCGTVRTRPTEIGAPIFMAKTTQYMFATCKLQEPVAMCWSRVS